MNRDLYHRISPAKSLLSAAVTEAADGAAVDLLGYESAVGVIDVGTLGGTDTPKLTMKLQESDDGTNFTDIAAADIVGGSGATPATIDIVAATDLMVHVIGYIGGKRYLRWICSAVSGTNPTAPMDAFVIRGNARYKS